MNVAMPIAAVMLDLGFPARVVNAVPILARTAGLIAHLYEEIQQPIGFALSYQATREMQYDGDVPEGFARK
jgi:citrate synthase